MATWAISDIHGCFDELQELLDEIALGDSDELYVLGDLADRGPKSADVLMWATLAPSNIRFLLGNHDDMMASVVVGDPAGLGMRLADPWSYNGGLETASQLKEETDPDWRTSVLAPWLQSRELFAHVEASGSEYMLVHAGFDPSAWGDGERIWCDAAREPHTRQERVDVGHGFGVQYAQTMIWAREGWLFARDPAPLTTVFGHTQTTVFNIDYVRDACAEDGIPFEGERSGLVTLHNRLDIDCGCAYGGALGALRLDDREFVRVPSRQD